MIKGEKEQNWCLVELMEKYENLTEKGKRVITVYKSSGEIRDDLFMLTGKRHPLFYSYFCVIHTFVLSFVMQSFNLVIMWQ